MNVFTNDETLNYLKLHLKNWIIDGTGIKREFKFKNFVEAFSFMTAAALEAEKADHHPDWSNAYNRVTIVLSTHSAGGITQLDFDLARKIDEIFKRFGNL